MPHSELDTVDCSHDHVGDDGIGTAYAAPVESILGAVHGVSVVAARTQNQSESAGDENVIVDNKDTFWRLMLEPRLPALERPFVLEWQIIGDQVTRHTFGATSCSGHRHLTTVPDGITQGMPSHLGSQSTRVFPWRSVLNRTEPDDRREVNSRFPSEVKSRPARPLHPLRWFSDVHE